MESYHDDSRGSDTRQCGRCFLMQPGDKFMDERYGPVGNCVNVCSDCLDRAFSELFAPTLGIYSAVETDTDATMVREDDGTMVASYFSTTTKTDEDYRTAKTDNNYNDETFRRLAMARARMSKVVTRENFHISFCNSWTVSFS